MKASRMTHSLSLLSEISSGVGCSPRCSRVFGSSRTCFVAVDLPEPGFPVIQKMLFCSLPWSHFLSDVIPGALIESVPLLCASASYSHSRVPLVEFTISSFR
ncbi:hypothetical protein BDV36DRAFT_250154 [Aspergillus pseudocaelatus]|uniref:Secreted protein n=1 Tax=Aspergillus pseudocaelatus TaxID=1825620 RepID=A0ABQ6WSQ6_9EURO|nr:hypothetical protein BDV36DRAFT_250154 [Aspergillus pseudocaelatus]